ncbi:peroxiredoxin [Ectothiorhodospiraceae bacterium 2226]|nr:peroxiredoxin [Ectothiorhodospiraceae bacterium 2226]
MNDSTQAAGAVQLDQPVPDFTLPATGDSTVTLSQLRGSHVVLYFYPKDSTPGCTREGQDFRDLYDQFVRAGAVVYGISRDSLRSHENFRAKQGFPFALLSDAEEQVCRLFEVIKEKNMYGRRVMGIERSTFLIDREGVLRREWRKVRVEGHAAEVLEAVRALG